MALEAIVDRKGAYRVVLEEYPEGVYVLVYDTAAAADDGPCQDHLQDDWQIAKRQALDDFGVTEDQWTEIPDTFFNGRWR
jgi:hypothetical protein